MHSGFKESTGDFSLPAEGFLYENGKMVGPVDQFVVSGNIFEVLNSIEEVGSEYGKPGNSIMTPDVLVKELSFAGA
ncbi:peptidase PmbA [compost metagenome]